MKLTKDGMNKSSQNADNSMYEITKKMKGTIGFYIAKSMKSRIKLSVFFHLFG